MGVGAPVGRSDGAAESLGEGSNVVSSIGLSVGESVSAGEASGASVSAMVGATEEKFEGSDVGAMVSFPDCGVGNAVAFPVLFDGGAVPLLSVVLDGEKVGDAVVSPGTVVALPSNGEKVGDGVSQVLGGFAESRQIPSLM